MAGKIKVASLEIDMKSIIEATKELKDSISVLKKEQELLKLAGKENSEAFIENTAVLKNLKTAYNANVKAISESGQAKEKEIQGIELLNLALETEVNTIAEARAQNKLLNTLRNETNVSTAEGKAQLNALNKKLDENNAFIKENADAYLQQKINIGNYQSALQGLSPTLNGYVSQLQSMYANLLSVKEGLIAQAAATNTTTTATGGASKALNLFKIALVSTGIGAIVVALGLLVTYLTTTQSGIDKVTAVTRPLQAIMQSLIGVLQNVGKYLFDAFSNPKKLLSDLADFVKSQLINRFKAFGVILDGIINLDFKKVSDGVLQAGTGVENMTDKIKNATKETGKFLDEAIKKGQELDRLEKELEKTRIANKVTLGQLTEEVKAQNRIAEDQTKTLAQREEATRLSIIAAQNINKLKQQELDLEIAILKNKQSRNDTSREEEQQLAELIAKKNEANAQELELVTTQTNKLNSIRKEAQAKAVEAENKRIDNLIKKNQEELDLFIAQQGFKKKSTEEELTFNKQVYDKELANLKVLYDKGKISKLQYETDKLNLSNDFAKQTADILIAEGERELEIIKNNSKLSLDAKLQSELDYQKLRLEQGIINEQQYQDAISQVQNEYDTLRLNKRLEDEALERDRKAIDLENKRANDQLTFEQDVELQREQNAIKLEEELLAAEKSGADQQLIKDKYAQLDKRLTQSVEDFKIQSLSNTFGQISNLFGQQSKIGKAFALYQAGIDGYQSVMKAFNSQFIPGDPSSLPRAIGAGAFAGAFAVKQIAGIAGAKFEKGGIQEIGGKRHSDGGTKFYGEDGTYFEAEAGEGIGILNRSAFSTFMDFNNRFGSGSSSSGFFQGGGIITQGVRTESNNLDAVVEAIANIPSPVVAVEEIQSVGNRFVQVQQNANL